MTTEPVTLPGSEVRMIDSQQNGRRYRITINLPLGYGKAADAGWPFSRTPARCPVVYVLDGNWYHSMVAGMIGPMSWCGSINDAMVVGIGYPESDDRDEAFRESFTRRDHDLTPIREEATEKSMEQGHGRPVPNGDAAGFLRFMRDELIPMIERDFLADPARRILVGHSYGGLFGLYALLEAPGLFDALVLGSPTLSYGERFMFTHEEAFAKGHKALPATVFLFAGEHEESLGDTTLTDTLRFAAILEGRGYEGLTVSARLFTGQNHCEVAIPGIQAGLLIALKSR